MNIIKLSIQKKKNKRLSKIISIKKDILDRSYWILNLTNQEL